MLSQQRRLVQVGQLERAGAGALKVAHDILMHEPAPRTRRTVRSRRCAAASRSPGLLPDSTSSARSATAEPSSAGTRSAAIAGSGGQNRPARRAQPLAGRRRPQLGGPLGCLGHPVGRDRIVHQRRHDRRDGGPPARRGHVEIPQLEVAAQPDRREQRGQVDIEVSRCRRLPPSRMAPLAHCSNGTGMPTACRPVPPGA